MDMKRLGLCLGILSTSGCVGFPEAPEDQPSAVMTIVKGSELAKDDYHTFKGFSDSECSDNEPMGLLATINANSKEGKSIRLAANKPMFVLLKLHHWKGWTAAYDDDTYCESLASFVPLEGHSYHVRQSSNWHNCALMVTDDQTGRPPASFRPLPVNTCTRWNQSEKRVHDQLKTMFRDAKARAKANAGYQD